MLRGSRLGFLTIAAVPLDLGNLALGGVARCQHPANAAKLRIKALKVCRPVPDEWQRDAALEELTRCHAHGHACARVQQTLLPSYTIKEIAELPFDLRSVFGNGLDGLTVVARGVRSEQVCAEQKQMSRKLVIDMNMHLSHVSDFDARHGRIRCGHLVQLLDWHQVYLEIVDACHANSSMKAQYVTATVRVASVPSTCVLAATLAYTMQGRLLVPPWGPGQDFDSVTEVHATASSVKQQCNFD